MNKKIVIYFSIAIALIFIGMYIHLTYCIHPRINTFELSNFIAHTLIYGSLFFVVLILKNWEVEPIQKKGEDEIQTSALSDCEGTTKRQLTFMILVTKLFIIISDKRFVVVANCLISLLMGWGLYKLTGNLIMIFISLAVQFYLTKYWIVKLYSDNWAVEKREFEIELQVYQEAKKMKVLSQAKIKNI